MTEVIITTNLVQTVNIELTAITGGVLPDGIVENTDETYSDTVANGSTLVIPDINITKNDDSVVQSPAAIDLDLRIIDPVSLQSSWDAENDTEKNTFVDANEEEILSFIDVSIEALIMLNKYSTEGVALAGTERSSMITYVDSEVTSGNHAKKDYEVIFSLSGVNGLIDFIGGKTATAVNNPTHNVSGYTTDGSTNYILTNFIPSVDGVKYTLNDCSVSVFCKTIASLSGLQSIFGSVTSPFNMILNNADLNKLVRYVNQATSTGSDITSTQLLSDSFYQQNRTASNLNNLFRNGASLGTGNTASTSLPPSDFTVGGRTSGQFLPCTVSSFTIGSAIGLNNSDSNTNMRTLLTSLGAI